LVLRERLGVPYDHPAQDDRLDAFRGSDRTTHRRSADLERTLEPLRSGRSPSLKWPPHAASARSPRRWLYGLAAAAAVVLAAGALALQWRWSWPAGRAWSVTSNAAVSSRLVVGSALDLAGSDRATVRIARIGTMEVEGDARVTLQSTQGTRHRLNLERGTVRVRVCGASGAVV
jgi:hypothetical protein